MCAGRGKGFCKKKYGVSEWKVSVFSSYNSEPFPSERDGMYPITENVEWTTGILDRTNLADVRLEQGRMF